MSWPALDSGPASDGGARSRVEVAKVLALAPARRRSPPGRVEMATRWMRTLHAVPILWALAGLHVVAVTWLSWSGGLFVDDIRAQAYAAGRPPWPFIVESNRTHLSPGARTIDWFMATYAPLQHWPAVVLTAVIATTYAFATVRLLNRVVSNGPARVIGGWWLLFAASVIPTYAWFRQALTTMLPLALTMVAACLTIDRFRKGRPALLAAAVAIHALALTFSERALAIPFVIIVIVACHRLPGRWRSGRAWSRVAVEVLPHALLNVAFLIAYLNGDFDRAQGARPSAADAVLKIGRWVGVDLLPSFVGGPLTWRSGIPPYSFASTPLALAVAACLVFLVGAILTVRRRSALGPAAPVVLAAAAYAVPVMGLIYIGRLAQVDDITSVDDLRLLPDVSASVALALAAVIGVLLDSRAPRRTARRDRQRVVRFAGAVILTVLVVAGTATSWLGFGLRWQQSVARPYLTTMHTAVASTNGQVLPTPLPAEIVPGWVDAELTTAPLIELVNGSALRDTLDGRPSVISDTGELRPAGFGRIANAPVPEGFCGLVLPVGSQGATLQLSREAPFFRGSIVTLGVIVGDATKLNLSVMGRDGRVHGPLVSTPSELLRGPHRIQALVPYGVAVRSVTVHVETPNTAGVCVTSAEVQTVRAGS